LFLPHCTQEDPFVSHFQKQKKAKSE
jgi:hypothetical protein